LLDNLYVNEEPITRSSELVHLWEWYIRK